MNKKIYIAPTTQAFAIVQQQMLATSFDRDMTGSGDGVMLSNRKGSGSIWGNEESSNNGGIWK